MLDFKDLTVVDTLAGEDDFMNYRAQRRKRRGLGGGPVGEALSLQQRLKRARSLRKNKSKIRMGRLRAKRRVASLPILKKRSRRAARNIVLKKITKGIPKSELTYARKQEIEKKLERMGGRIDRIAKKLLPKIRKAELARKRGGGSK